MASRECGPKRDRTAHLGAQSFGARWIMELELATLQRLCRQARVISASWRSVPATPQMSDEVSVHSVLPAGFSKCVTVTLFCLVVEKSDSCKIWNLMDYFNLNKYFESNHSLVQSAKNWFNRIFILIEYPTMKNLKLQILEFWVFEFCALAVQSLLIESIIYSPFFDLIEYF